MSGPMYRGKVQYDALLRREDYTKWNADTFNSKSFFFFLYF